MSVRSVFGVASMSLGLPVVLEVTFEVGEEKVCALFMLLLDANVITPPQITPCYPCIPPLRRNPRA
jgi:hypothetical protein